MVPALDGLKLFVNGIQNQHQRISPVRKLTDSEQAKELASPAISNAEMILRKIDQRWPAVNARQKI